LLWVPDIYPKFFNLHNTHKKAIAKLDFFILISKILKNNNRSEISQRSEISLDTGLDSDPNLQNRLGSGLKKFGVRTPQHWIAGQRKRCGLLPSAYG